ncbi:hypothetical protein JYK14_03815 [Siccirubricoccus sp. KC 17139]|uniref:Solute-binding protein family 3/N-terminal domain-containing protein n=1 Tax=Siccirubricoccus soli TaxID=2899147 RepID=A0ABT1D234_9PROT|nr:hypothetical protein [Siccirubricoccus soli]MCO6415304.1 hypothetical protein [Siccirubricoccus soli]MCP2681435.1 hypothetical protein [Siccirubricoccus soli]
MADRLASVRWRVSGVSGVITQHGADRVGVEDAWQARRFAAAQPAVVALFGSAPYNVLPINRAIKRGNQDLVEFMNTAIDFMRTTGRWEKMAEPYGATGRFWAKPQPLPFGPEA